MLGQMLHYKQEIISVLFVSLQLIIFTLFLLNALMDIDNKVLNRALLLHLVNYF